MINKRIDKTKKVSKALFLLIMALILSTLTYTLTNAQVTTFNNSLSTLSLRFPQEFLTQNFFVRVPNGTVTEARMIIRGSDIQGRKGLPADVVLVTDTSGSMSCSVSSPCKITAAQNADETFLDNVNLLYTHVGLVQYAYPSLTKLNENLTDNDTELRREINNYRANGWTDMGKGMELAMNQLLSSHARSDAPKYIIVMTDGWPNCDATNNDSNCGGSYRAGAVDYVRNIVNQCIANNIIIYGISFGDCGGVYDTGADCNLMQQITTNGVMYNAPDPATLAQIYNQIAQEIDVNEAPTPIISSTSPRYLAGWRYPTAFSDDALWNNADCGYSGAVCSDFRNIIQSNLNQCTTSPCDIMFSVYSSTVGMLNLSDLFIEINEPPAGNYPPIGSCLQVPMLCSQDVAEVGIDDAGNGLVTDANDALSSLTWRYDSFIESLGGSHFDYNSNFNTVRRLAFLADMNHYQEAFWKTFFFNISDPWGASTMSCINVSYAGCGVSVCGNGPPPGLGEQCELNNTINNWYCNQNAVNCSQAPLATIRDSHGNCNNTCGCVEDPWSEQARCIADSCGAVCSNDQTQPCTAPGGYPGIQTCNITTCQWNNCYPEGTCGDTIINQAEEQCEPNDNQKNLNCHQENESCDGPRLATRPDQTGLCNVACECYNDSWSSAICTANKCGATCSDEQTLPCAVPGGFPGIQTCNITTCQWNTCTPTGICGDGTINQQLEQCEISEIINSVNNTFCTQDIENCTDAPWARVRDLHGNCDATCGCIEDVWGEPSCVAEICGASCTAETNQACTTADGYPGNQDCNETTCGWNNCITILRCGDNIITSPPESCELPDTGNNSDCNQSIEQCVGPKIAARDSYGDCGTLCTCAYDIFGEAANCSVSKCGAACDITTPPQDCTTTSGHEGTRTCDLTTCTMGGCTRNPLSCESSIPNYLLHTGQHISIDIDDIFSGDTGGADSISYSHSHALSITHDSSISALDVSSDNATFETVDITIRVEGVDSQTCSVRFLNLDSKCDNSTCEAYADAEDFEGLRANNCLDNEIWVTDPHAAVRVSDYISNFLFPGFASRNLEYTADFEVFDGFGVFPSSGNRHTTFYITNLTNLTHGTENSSVIKITFDDYENPLQDYVRICPKLVRYHYNIGDLGYDPNSTLLITGSRSVTGYYEKDGFVFSKGPYIFIAKVWMRE